MPYLNFWLSFSLTLCLKILNFDVHNHMSPCISETHRPKNTKPAIQYATDTSPMACKPPTIPYIHSFPSFPLNFGQQLPIFVACISMSPCISATHSAKNAKPVVEYATDTSLLAEKLPTIPYLHSLPSFSLAFCQDLHHFEC